MNFCQRFKHPGLEHLYQKSRKHDHVQYQKYLAIWMLAYNIISFIHSLVNDIQILWASGILLYSLLLLISSFKTGQSKAKLIFVLGLNGMIISQLQLDQQSEPQFTYFRAQNYMAYVILIIYMYSFRETLLQLLMITGARIAIQFHLAQIIEPFVIAQSVIVSASILGMSYFIEQNDRSKFMLNLSNQQWEQSLPVVVQNPFILFTFDKERLNFNYKLGNDLQFLDLAQDKTSSEKLRIFLRSYKVGNDCFEQYILQIKHKFKQDFNKIYKQKLKIVKSSEPNDHKKYFITFSQFYLNETVFLVVFDQNEQKISSLDNVKQALIKGINQHQELTIKFLTKQMALINYSFNQSNSLECLYKLKIHCMYFMGKYVQCNSFQEAEEQIEEINLISMVQQLLYIYNKAYKTLNIEILNYENDNDIIIWSNPQLVQMLFVLILQTIVRVNKDNALTIYIQLQHNTQSDNKIVNVSVYFYKVEQLAKQLTNTSLMHKIQTRICPKDQVLVKNEQVQFQLYQDIRDLNDVRLLQEELE